MMQTYIRGCHTMHLCILISEDCPLFVRDWGSTTHVNYQESYQELHINFNMAMIKHIMFPIIYHHYLSSIHFVPLDCPTNSVERDEFSQNLCFYWHTTTIPGDTGSCTDMIIRCIPQRLLLRQLIFIPMHAAEQGISIKPALTHESAVRPLGAFQNRDKLGRQQSQWWWSW